MTRPIVTRCVYPLPQACVVAAGRSPAHFTNTATTVASMLIARGDILRHTELLCAVGKGLEACKALQAHDRWEEAARLAKTLLPRDECNDVLQRWVQQLTAQGEAMQSACVLVSIGDMRGALGVLTQSEQDAEAAALLALMCEFKYCLTEAQPELAQLCFAAFQKYRIQLEQIGNLNLSAKYKAMLQETQFHKNVKLTDANSKPLRTSD